MNIPTPLRAIRLKCLDCSCGSAQEVRECPIEACPLYYYRSGHNPKRKGVTNKNPNTNGITKKSGGESEAKTKSAK